MVRIVDGKSHGQFTRRISTSADDVGDGIATLLSWLPSQQYGIRPILPTRRGYPTANVQHHHNLLTCLVESPADAVKHRCFFFGEVEVALYIAVGTFTRIAPQGHNGNVIIRRTGAINLI